MKIEDLPTHTLVLNKKPRLSFAPAASHDMKQRLLTAFMEAMQSSQAQSPETTFSVFKTMLKKLQVPKLCQPDAAASEAVDS